MHLHRVDGGYLLQLIFYLIQAVGIGIFRLHFHFKFGTQRIHAEHFHQILAGFALPLFQSIFARYVFHAAHIGSIVPHLLQLIHIGFCSGFLHHHIKAYVLLQIIGHLLGGQAQKCHYAEQ